MRSSPSAVRVPMMAESVAVESAMTTEVHSARRMSGLEKALPYHMTEKPCQSMAYLPALNEKNTISVIGR